MKQSVRRLCKAAFLRGRAVSFSELGLSIRQISGRLNVPKSNVARWLHDYKVSGSYMPLTSPGRRPKTSDRADRRLARLASKDPVVSASRLKQQWQEAVSTSTVYRRLAAKLIKKYRMMRKPKLSAMNCLVRERWAMNHNIWTEDKWHRVVFTDESRFRLNVSDGRVRVWRKRGQRFHKEFVQPTVAQQSSIHVWGAIWYGGKSPLRILTHNVTGATYCETLNLFLQTNNLPLNWILMDDNARPHRAAIVNEFKTRHGIRSLSSWPPYSPDLNPIENAWDYLGRRVQDRGVENLQQLAVMLQKEWDSMPQQYIDTLVGSMRRRIGAVLRSRGSFTKY